MSYILEALKKAQAERQLGNAPTIHAAQPVPAPQVSSGAGRRPLYVGLGAGALVVVLGALLLWHRAPAPAAHVVAQAPAATVAPAMTAPAAPAAPLAATRTPAAAEDASAAPVVSVPPAPPRSARAAEAPARSTGSGAKTAAAAGPHANAAPVATSAAMPATPPASPAPSPAQAPAPSRAPAPEESLPYLAQLPDAVQREVPRVVFGGYMYSANPADRLLIVDKALRHEGDEVAPGLVLEKLLPKAAVMNYRGKRYRVAY
jgi:general secretion pathway protein B